MKIILKHGPFLGAIGNTTFFFFLNIHFKTFIVYRNYELYHWTWFFVCIDSDLSTKRRFFVFYFLDLICDIVDFTIPKWFAIVCTDQFNWSKIPKQNTHKKVIRCLMLCRHLKWTQWDITTNQASKLERKNVELIVI